MKRLDITLLITVVLLTFFGLFMIYDASSVIAFRDFGDKYHYIKDQLVWEIIGLVVLAVSTLFNYKRYYSLALPILVVAIVMLVLVFMPGIGLKILGARRWINLGFTSFQPSEFAKLALAIYLSAWFSIREKGRFLAFSLLIGVVLLLIMAQPDMGTASIILFEAFIAYYLSGATMSHFFILLPVTAALGFILIKLEPYRAARLTAFLNLGKSLEGASYHVKQILIALGSGGILGVGVGNSLQKYA
jgi:cell division protein FtsW